jgi:hypothetical protein
MKRFLQLFLFILGFAACGSKAEAQTVLSSDSIVMSASYANEVYYSMKNGIVSTTPRDMWDIAFRTRVMSSSIIINDGTGVVLFTYPKSDTSGWATVDTTGIGAWTPMYNDPTDWENGAFSRNQQGHPDYGWGRYNDVTHDIVGDSLYVIKLRNGVFKKLWIQRKHSGGDTWYFKYADLDGSNVIDVTKDMTSLQSVDFYGYNMEADLWANFEPAAAEWDILFTKYKGINSGQPYTVTGVLSNDSVKVNKFHPVSPDYVDWNLLPWDSTRSPIGYDWKVFNSGTSTYVLTDSLVYFVKDRLGDVYKLLFTRFEGSSTGKVVFKKALVSGVGIKDQDRRITDIRVFPNPANETINLIFNEPVVGSPLVTLSDISGKVIFRNTISNGITQFGISAATIQPGIYFVAVTVASVTSVRKVIISR